MSHTKNTWEIGFADANWINIVADDGRTDSVDSSWTVARVNRCMGQESLGHARLIVAAPQLLAEAFKLVAQLKTVALHPSHYAGLEAAVAKAIEG